MAAGAGRYADPGRELRSGTASARSGWVPERPARIGATMAAEQEGDGALDTAQDGAHATESVEPRADGGAAVGSGSSSGDTRWWQAAFPAGVRHGTLSLGRAHVAVIILLVLAGAVLGACTVLASSPEVVPVRAQTVAAQQAPVSDDPSADGAAAVPSAGTDVAATTDADAGAEPAPPGPASRGIDAGPASNELLLVHVTGLIERPGVVALAPGSRVVDAIDAAGGLQDGADLGGLNLAQVLTDGQQVLVGIEPPEGSGFVVGGTEPGPTDAVDGDGSAGSLVNLNTAGLAELDELPGIGPALAQRILDWRETNGAFTDVAELLEVSGIGESRLEDLRDLVTW